MTSYDQKPGEPYGVCSDCSLSIATNDDAREHMDQTMAVREGGERRSHRIQITNATRHERIRRMVDEVVQDAIEEALDNLRDKIAQAQVSSDEVTGALTYYPDFRDEWDRG